MTDEEARARLDAAECEVSDIIIKCGSVLMEIEKLRKKLDEQKQEAGS